MLPALLVAYADPGWTFDPARGRLRGNGAEYDADAIFAEGDLRVFEIRGVAP
jgi:hypothetical protein